MSDLRPGNNTAAADQTGPALDLFGQAASDPLPPGAQLHLDFLTTAQESWLMDRIDVLAWDNSIARRRQWYGERYLIQQGSGGPAPGQAIGGRESLDEETTSPRAMPDFLKRLAHLMVERDLFAEAPTNALINEYLPGQGIAAHTDRLENVGEGVVSLSLLSDVVMDFECLDSGAKRSAWLPARSLLSLRGPARYRWTHGIAKRLSDPYRGQRVPRRRRVSVTMRENKRRGWPR